LSYFNNLWQNITEKLRNQYLVFPSHLTNASALHIKTWKHGIGIFSLKCRIAALPNFNHSLLDFFILDDSRLILTLLYDSLNIVSNGFHFWAVDEKMKLSFGPTICCWILNEWISCHSLQQQSIPKRTSP